MGYVARSVSAQDVINGVFLTTGVTIAKSRTITGSTPDEVYKLTINFTNIDFLYYEYTAKDNATGNTDSEIKIGGTSKADNNNQADGTVNSGGIDCTSITGNNALTIEVNNTTTGVSHLEDINFYTRES